MEKAELENPFNLKLFWEVGEVSDSYSNYNLPE